jgi:hypothetical protein
MKVEAKTLIKSFKDLPRIQRKLIGDAIRTSTLEGVRWARTLAPVDSGDLRAGIHAKFEFGKESLRGSVEAAPEDGPSQAKALSVEFGRRYTRKSRVPGRRGLKNRGTTKPISFIRETQKLLGRKHKNRIRTALRKAAKQAGLA